MKMFRKSLLLVISMLCITGGFFAAYGASFWVTSPSVRVDVQYSVSLSTFSIVGGQITLNALVANGVNPVGAGISVDFYYSLNNGVDWTYIETKTTDAGGIAQSTYVATQNGVYDFKAIAAIP